MNLATKIVAVVPASGVGSRMLASLPKQYLVIDTFTLLEHTVFHLLSHKEIDSVVVVISKEDIYFEQTSLFKHPKVKVAFGGKERADSVLAGLRVTDAQWVMVHDAARPCVHHSDIDKLIHTAMNENDGAILAMKAKDTIKQVNEDCIVSTIDRSVIWHALTPQMFRREQLIKALKQAKEKNLMLTDDASAIEFMGGKPKVVEGRSDNIKVTLPEDLALAAYFLKQNKE